MPKLGSGDVVKCSFCGKTQQQVIKLIAGPGVYICDQCIDLCNQIVEEEIGKRPERVRNAEIDAAARSAIEAVNRLRDLGQQAQAPSDPGDQD